MNHTFAGFHCLVGWLVSYWLIFFLRTHGHRNQLIRDPVTSHDPRMAQWIGERREGIEHETYVTWFSVRCPTPKFTWIKMKRHTGAHLHVWGRCPGDWPRSRALQSRMRQRQWWGGRRRWKGSHPRSSPPPGTPRATRSLKDRGKDPGVGGWLCVCKVFLRST